MKKMLLHLKKLLFENKCAGCRKILKLDEDEICETCLKKLMVNSSVKKIGSSYYIWEYSDLFKQIIFRFKFFAKKSTGDIFSTIIYDKIRYIIEKEKIDIIIPVPIHSRRKNKRGFNQAEEILSGCGIEFLKVKRIKNTKHMWGMLSAEQRRENISNCFDIKDKEKINGKNILIFDDIITTGNTAEELTRELQRGTDGVRVITMALAAGRYFKSKCKGVYEDGFRIC